MIFIYIFNKTISIIKQYKILFNSINQRKDKTEKDFDFDINEQQVFFPVPLKTRMLQLKVRFKAIILNIAKSPMPEQHITNYLVSLIDEERCFPDDYFYQFEKDELDFDRFILLLLFL
jgi:hypothetical protein